MRFLIENKLLYIYFLIDVECTPGPYDIREAPRGPQFSIAWRHPEKAGFQTPGPNYDVNKFDETRSGPAFTM